MAQDPLANLGVPATPTPAAPASSAPDPLASLGVPAEAPSAAPPTPSQPQESTLQKTVNFPQRVNEGIAEGIKSGLDVQNDINKGIVQGVGQDVAGVASLINKIPVVGETLAPAEGVTALRQMSTPQTTAQKIGAGAEAVMEFIAGDEALKGLSLAEKFDLASKIAKMSENSPTLAKAMLIGMKAVRGGTVGASEALEKGQTPTQALGTGAEVAGGGAALDVLGEGAGYVRSAIRGESAAQAPARAALTNPWAGARAASKSLRTFLDPEILKAQTIADTNFNAVDEQAPGLKDMVTKLDRTERAIRGAVDPDVEARLELQRKQLQDGIKDSMDKLGPKGMAQYQAANDAFARAKALEDLRDDIFMNTGVVEGNALAGQEETINVDRAVKKLQELDDYKPYGRSRLAQAIGGTDGEQKAQQALKELYAAQKAGVKAMRAQRVLKILGIGAGATGLLSYGVHRTIYDYVMGH